MLTITRPVCMYVCASFLVFHTVSNNCPIKKYNKNIFLIFSLVCGVCFACTVCMYAYKHAHMQPCMCGGCIYIKPSFSMYANGNRFNFIQPQIHLQTNHNINNSNYISGAKAVYQIKRLERFGAAQVASS